MGDFNVVRDINERSSPNAHNLLDIAQFNSCILKSCLEDINTTGCAFTWIKKQGPSTRVWSKLDRALVNQSWVHPFNALTAFIPPSGVSDHSYIIVSIF